MQNESFEEVRNREYNHYVEQVTEKTSLTKNMFLAFLVGGGICAVGQAILEILQMNGISEDDSASIMIIILIFCSILLTGFNIYPKLGNFAGAGTLVPITGFANSIAASAIEFRAEGYVFGVGCRIFGIAGPVILYGIVASFVCGLISYLIYLF